MRKVLKMAKSKLEYIWLDGYHPTQSLRSKTRIVEDFSGDVADAPIWSFDGSSTEQATGDSSDCLLKPVAAYPDPDRLGGNGRLIMTEVLNADGTPKVVVKESQPEKLSLKQQARRDAEEKEARDRAEQKRQRLETLEKIKKDNHARKHDENWTTTEGVQKGGKDINTFRGKYGEDKGG